MYNRKILSNFLTDVSARRFPADFIPLELEKAVEKHLSENGRLISLFWAQHVIMLISAVVMLFLLPSVWAVPATVLVAILQLAFALYAFAVDPALCSQVEKFNWHIHFAAFFLFGSQEWAERNDWARMSSGKLMGMAYDKLKNVAEYQGSTTIYGVLEIAHDTFFTLGMVKYDLSHFKDMVKAA